MKEKTKNRLLKTFWYHGTTLEGFENILSVGVIADYNNGYELDFGAGFYLAESAAMAENYIRRLPFANRELVIMEFEFAPLGFFVAEGQDSAVFENFDDRFAEFVFNNRDNPGRRVHTYNIIYGVMTDGVPTFKMAEYRAGEIGREDVLLEFKKGTSMKQLSLHNQQLCDKLILTRAYRYSPGNEQLGIADERKELDVSEREHN